MMVTWYDGNEVERHHWTGNFFSFKMRPTRAVIALSREKKLRETSAVF